MFLSSNPAVATVDAAGLVTAVAPGAADIVVEYDDVSTTVSTIVSGPFVSVPPAALAAALRSASQGWYRSEAVDPESVPRWLVASWLADMAESSPSLSVG